MLKSPIQDMENVYGVVREGNFIHKDPLMPELYLIEEEAGEREFILYEHEFLVIGSLI